LEFNARFGDPECQPIMMRLKSDLVPLLEASIDGTLNQISAQWYEDPAVCIVLCAAGYPGSYEKGKNHQWAGKTKKLGKRFVFHAGTAQQDGQWVTSGGRVLGVTARGQTIASAIDEAYGAVKQIAWDGMHYRKDYRTTGIESV
jgi:phosphoribosylamine--glycine ligase